MTVDLRVYALLDPAQSGGRSMGELAALVGPAVTLVQLRDKHGSTREMIARAKEIKAALPAHVPLLINDRVDVALAAGADGVHLGQTDLPLAEARAIAGDRLLYGISTHDAAQMARAYVERPAYAAYGPVFTTTTKKNPDPVQGLEALAHAVRVAGDVPVVAIGGIAPRDANSVFATGVSAICAISSVNQAVDVGEAARCMSRSGVAPSPTGE